MQKSKHLFPVFLAKPISIVPNCVHAAIISKALNRLFREQIADGELDFLSGKNLRVGVLDLGIRFTLSFEKGRFFAAGNKRKHDLAFCGNLHDFLLLITRKEDSDTLFFQRRLKIEGDTEMGLGIKNFLDAIEMESLPYHRQIDVLLGRVVQLYERVT